MRDATDALRDVLRLVERRAESWAALVAKTKPMTPEHWRVAARLAEAGDIARAIEDRIAKPPKGGASTP